MSVALLAPDANVRGQVALVDAGCSCWELECIIVRITAFSKVREV